MNLFSIGRRTDSRGGEAADTPETAPPEGLRELPESRFHDVDVRPVLARGEEPLALILDRASRVAPGDVLRVRTPFEPVPLYAVLARRGFEAWTERLAPDDWRVWFHRSAARPGA